MGNQYLLPWTKGNWFENQYNENKAQKKKKKERKEKKAQCQ